VRSQSAMSILPIGVDGRRESCLREELFGGHAQSFSQVSSL